MEWGSGIPHGSVLGSTLWNVLYDGVLGLGHIGFAGDLGLVVGARNESILMNNANKCPKEISTWMKNRVLMITPAKNEAVIINRGRNHNIVMFMLNGVRILPKKFVRYLGAIIDERGNYGPHTRMVVGKAEKRIVKLTALLPRIEGSRSSRRAILAGAVPNILLYGAPIWIKALQQKTNVEQLGRP